MSPKCECTCSICGKVIRSRASKKRTGRENLFRAMTTHQRKNHRTALNRRIKAGIQRAKEATESLDAVGFREQLTRTPEELLDTILSQPPTQRRQAINIIDRFVQPFLPPEQKTAWRLIKAAVKLREKKTGIRRTRVITPSF